MSETIPENPFALFGAWLNEAEKTEPRDPNAMALSAIDKNGRPSVRMVLLKDHGPEGFTFFTNYESQKGEGLLANPYAELCLYWKNLNRQVRVAGPVRQVSASESDEYFQTRPRRSRIGAWASRQTRPMRSYEELEQRFKEIEDRYENTENIPRPPHWGGFRVAPERIEFWEDRPFRLHKRFVYVRSGEGWETTWLHP